MVGVAGRDVEQQVELAGAQLRHPRLGVGDDDVLHPVEVRRAVPVLFVGVERDRRPRLPGGEPERTGPVVPLAGIEVGQCVDVDDRHDVEEVEEVAGGPGKREGDRVRIAGVEARDQGGCAGELPGPGRIGVRPDAGLDVRRGERLAVVEGDVVAQLQVHGQLVLGDRPGRRQFRLRIEAVGGVADEGVVDQSGDGGLRGGARVQRRGGQITTVTDSKDAALRDLGTGVGAGLVDRGVAPAAPRTPTTDRTRAPSRERLRGSAGRLNTGGPFGAVWR